MFQSSHPVEKISRLSSRSDLDTCLDTSITGPTDSAGAVGPAAAGKEGPCLLLSSGPAAPEAEAAKPRPGAGGGECPPRRGCSGRSGLPPASPPRLWDLWRRLLAGEVFLPFLPCTFSNRDQAGQVLGFFPLRPSAAPEGKQCLSHFAKQKLRPGWRGTWPRSTSITRVSPTTTLPSVNENGPKRFFLSLNGSPGEYKCGL